jgi:hypothetical protein
MSSKATTKPFSSFKTLLALAIVLAVAGVGAAHDLPGWAKHGDSPVLPRVEGEWDGGFINVPSVLHDGSTYHMWYSGCSGLDPLVCAIGYATSPDGIAWTKHPDNPVLTNGAPGEWDATGAVFGSQVISDGAGTFTMWYGWLGEETSVDGTAIGLATSTDGVSWTKHAGNPVLTGSGDDLVDQHSVVFDGQTYHMWYLTSYPGTMIGYASSPDGIAWTKHPDPVFEAAVGEGVWDENLYSQAVFLEGGTFHMLYSADTESTEVAIGYASSPDGITWTRGAEEPVLTPGINGNDWDACNIGFQGVMAHCGEARMYYYSWGCAEPEFEQGLGLATASMDEIAVEYPRADHLNDNRFEFMAAWWDSDGNVGTGVPGRLTNDTGSLWFFDEANLEVVLKVLDGCGVNGHYWVFAAGMTNVGVSITVTDTETNEAVYYLNDLGDAFQPVLDISAFTCE